MFFGRKEFSVSPLALFKWRGGRAFKSRSIRFKKKKKRKVTCPPELEAKEDGKNKKRGELLLSTETTNPESEASVASSYKGTNLFLHGNLKEALLTSTVFVLYIYIF